MSSQDRVAVVVVHGIADQRAITGGLPIALVTVGSPLRDLYAEHFPLLYRWMGSREAGFAAAGPSASEIGAVEWVNTCRSGDYVGRFVWTLPRHAFRIALVGSDGRVEAERARDRTEFRLGAGARTTTSAMTRSRLRSRSTV